MCYIYTILCVTSFFVVWIRTQKLLLKYEIDTYGSLNCARNEKRRGLGLKQLKIWIETIFNLFSFKCDVWCIYLQAAEGCLVGLRLLWQEAAGVLLLGVDKQFTRVDRQSQRPATQVQTVSRRRRLRLWQRVHTALRRDLPQTAASPLIDRYDVVYSEAKLLRLRTRPRPEKRGRDQGRGKID